MLEPILDILFDAIARNTSLENCDFSRCAISLVSTQRWMAALQPNQTLSNVVLPLDPGNYYLTVKSPTGAQDAIYGFAAAGEQDPGEAWFSLVGAPKGVFGDDLKKHAETFHEKLFDRYRALLRQAALPPLTFDVARLMTGAVGAQEESEANPGVFGDIASRVVASLESQGALRDIVHLSQTRKRDAKGNTLKYATKRKTNVKPYVRLHNKDAAAQRLPNAPLAINEVNRDGSNRALSEAVRDKNPTKVSQLLWDKAIDFGGKVERASPPGPLRSAFLPINRMNANGRNVRLQACVDDNDLPALRRLKAKGAIDFNGEVESAAPQGPLRNFIAVNRVDDDGANVQLIAAVKAGDAALVMRLRAEGAVDYGRRAWALARTMNSKELLAAFAKVAMAGRQTTTVTTTNTTATTTTTAATRSRFQQTRLPRRDPDKPDA